MRETAAPTVAPHSARLPQRHPGATQPPARSRRVQQTPRPGSPRKGLVSARFVKDDGVQHAGPSSLLWDEYEHTVYRHQTLYEPQLQGLKKALPPWVAERLDEELAHQAALYHRREAERDRQHQTSAMPEAGTSTAHQLPWHARKDGTAGVYVPSGTAPRGGRPRRTLRRRSATLAATRQAGSTIEADAAALGAVAGVEPSAVEAAARRQHGSEAEARLAAHAAASSSGLAHSLLLPPPPHALSRFARSGGGYSSVASVPRRRSSASGEGPGALNTLLSAVSDRKLLTREEEVVLVEAMQRADRIRATARQLAVSLGRRPTDDEVAEEAGCAGGARGVRAELEAGSAARQELVRCNLRLVLRIAARYRSKFSQDSNTDAVQLEDMVAVGIEGLHKGLARFDTSRGFKLSTYVYFWILNSMTQLASETKWAHRVPRGVMEQLHTLFCERRTFIEQHAREPTHAELQQLTGFKPQLYARLTRLRYLTELPLDSPLGGAGSQQQPGKQGDTYTLGDVVEDSKQQDPVAAAEAASLQSGLAQLLEKLPEKHALVLQRKYGLRPEPNGARPGKVSHKEIAVELGVSCGRVGQMHQEALQRLRRLGAEELAELSGVPLVTLLLKKSADASRDPDVLRSLASNAAAAQRRRRQQAELALVA